MDALSAVVCRQIFPTFYGKDNKLAVKLLQKQTSHEESTSKKHSDSDERLCTLNLLRLLFKFVRIFLRRFIAL